MTKRVAESQITKDDVEPSNTHDGGEATETRAKASEDVLSTRKIVSVRRSGQSKPESSDSTPIPTESLAPESKSLFSGLSMGGDAALKAAEVPSPEKPKSLFGGLAGLVASTESKPAEESSDKGLFSSLFAPLDTGAASSSGFGSFSFSAPSGESFPSFGAAKGDTPEEEGQESSEAEEEEEQPTIQTVVDHGENEEQVYQSDCKLFKLQKVEDEAKPNTFKWVEKGIGFVRIIKSTTPTTEEEGPTFRVVVRMKGVFRLMLNTGLIPSICKAEKVGNKSVKFTAVEDGNLADFRLNLLTEDNQSAFVALLPADLVAPAEK